MQGLIGTSGERAIVPSVVNEIGRRVRASAGEMCALPPVRYRRRLMNTTSSNGAYDPETVALLSRVLDESFMTLMNGIPVLDPEWRQGVRHRLA
jgi:hypothetical protein